MDDVLNNEVRKGFLKVMILGIIRHGPSHGYDIIQKIEKKTGGHWAPSPGSVYPALEFLEKKGYIMGEEVERKIVYRITPKGEKTFDHIHERRKQMLEELMVFFGDSKED